MKKFHQALNAAKAEALADGAVLSTDNLTERFRFNEAEGSTKAFSDGGKSVAMHGGVMPGAEGVNDCALEFNSADA